MYTQGIDMATIKQRLNALESSAEVYVPPHLVFVTGEQLTESQKFEVDDAERTGRKVIQIRFISIDTKV